MAHLLFLRGDKVDFLFSKCLFLPVGNFDKDLEIVGGGLSHKTSPLPLQLLGKDF